MNTLFAYIFLFELTDTHLRVIFITLLVKACVILGVLIVKRISLYYKTRAAVITFGNVLLNFSHFCRLHTSQILHLQQHYIPEKGHEFSGKSIADHGRHEIAVVFPDSTLKEFSSLLSDRRASRISDALMDIRYQLKFYNEDLHSFLHVFSSEYETARHEFYTSAYELGKLHDELKEYVKGKTLSKEAHDWTQGYFSIFESWATERGKDNPSALVYKVVKPVIAFNVRYPGVSFAGKTSEKAYACEQAFHKIEALDLTINNKLAGYSWVYRKALKISALIGQRIVSGKRSRTVFYKRIAIAKHQKYGMSEKLILGLGIIFFAVLCFFGGLYIGSGSHASLFAKTTPPPSVTIAIATPPSKAVTTVDVNPPAGLAAPVDTVDPKNDFLFIDTIKTIAGLDISKYQGNLLKDIEKLDTLHFVICKATQGITIVDEEFNYNWKKLKEYNVIRGAYHFYMSNDEPAAQATHFLKTVGNLENKDIPLIVDIEEASIIGKVNSDTLQSKLLAFLQLVEKHSRRKPIIYTDRYFADTWLRKDTFALFPLWLAQYSRKPSPILPKTWKKAGHVFWQKSDAFSIDSRKSDFDIFNGNGRDFAAFIKRTYL